MPFTPFHWGPALFIGLLLFPILDVPSLLISSVAVDIEPIYFMFQRSPGYLHGFFHSYLGASIIGIFVAMVVYVLRNPLNEILVAFKLPQRSSLKKNLFTSLFGVYFHVTLDSFMYIDSKPFYPLEINPLYGVIASYAIYQSCAFLYLFGSVLYIYGVVRKSRLSS